MYSLRIAQNDVLFSDPYNRGTYWTFYIRAWLMRMGLQSSLPSAHYAVPAPKRPPLFFFFRRDSICNSMTIDKLEENVRIFYLNFYLNLYFNFENSLLCQ